MTVQTNYSVNTPVVADVAALRASVGITGGDTYAFTPDTLIAYCSSRLDSIDQKIDAYFKEQQGKNRASKELDDLQAILSNASSQAGSEAIAKNEHGDIGIHTQEGNDILKIYRETKDPQVKKAAAEAFQIRTGMSPEDVAGRSVTADDIEKSAKNGWIKAQDEHQWAGNIEKIKGVGSSISKSAELNMIQLQSLVSQRQLCVQLTTQLMQAVHEGSKNVAGNIRA